MSEHYSKREASGIGCIVACIAIMLIGTLAAAHIVMEAACALARLAVGL